MRDSFGFTRRLSSSSFARNSIRVGEVQANVESAQYKDSLAAEKTIGRFEKGDGVLDEVKVAELMKLKRMFEDNYGYQLQESLAAEKTICRF